MKKKIKKISKNKKNNQRKHTKSQIANYSSLLKILNEPPPKIKKNKILRRKTSVEIFKNRSDLARHFTEVQTIRQKSQTQPLDSKQKVQPGQPGLKNNNLLDKKKSVCNRRTKRRISLFATGKAGSGKKPNKHRIFTEDSKINCRR